MASVSIEMDLPEGVDVVSYERFGDGHCFEVAWPLPECSQCERCRHEEASKFETKDKAQVVRDLDVWGQPSFWCYPTAFHRCSRCNHRQHVLAPFKRKNVTYTFRFEEHVLQMLVGSIDTEVAARLGISAETVALIVRNQLQELRQVDPARVITDTGLDEISLKKRHKLFVTILTDLSDPQRPRVLAVAKGKDEAAAKQCLECLSEEQRRQVQTCRVDMSMAYHNAAEKMLPNAKRIVDRFHVAKKFNEAVDAERKKNHEGLQEEIDEATTQGVPLTDVGVSPPAGGSECRGEAEVGGAVCQVAEAEDAV
jgi:transposase